MPSDNGNNKHDNGHRVCMSTPASFGQIHLLTRVSFESQEMGDKKRTSNKRRVREIKKKSADPVAALSTSHSVEMCIVG